MSNSGKGETDGKGSKKKTIKSQTQIGHYLKALGFSEQTVERRGSLVFCVSKSSEVERERVKSLERNERVCGKSPTQVLIPVNSCTMH